MDTDMDNDALWETLEDSIESKEAGIPSRPAYLGARRQAFARRLSEELMRRQEELG